MDKIHGNKGKIHSLEHRKNLSESLKGRKTWNKNKYIDISNQKFGLLTVIELGFIKKTKCGNRAYWKCKCDCGNEKIINGYNLRTGVTKSCGCIVTNRYKKRPYEYLYNHFKTINKKRRPHLIISLTYEEFVEFTKIDKCHYCEREIKWHSHGHSTNNSFKYNLDRKDNSIGYNKDNCVVCCYDCNLIKSNKYNYEEMMILKPSLIKIQELRKLNINVDN